MRKKDLLMILSLILSLFLAGCGGGGGGGGGISLPESIISPPPAVARNDSGKAIVAYLRDAPSPSRDKVYVNYYDGQNWSGPLQISEPQKASKPEVAISDNGDAIVVWAENGNILAKIYSNGSWSENYTIAGPYEGIDEEDFSVAMYPNGDAIVVWSTGKQIIKREYKSANNNWDNPVAIYNVQNSTLDSVSFPLVAIDKSAQPSPIADFVWLHSHTQDQNDSTYQEILFSLGGGQPRVVWKLVSNPNQLPQVGYYLKPTSLMVTCDVIIGIHYTKVEFPVPPNTTRTITTQAYASINPDGITTPTAISNPRTTTVSTFDPNAIPAPMVGEPLVVMDNQCNAIGVWEELEGSGEWQDHVWFNVYQNFSWQGPQRITTIDTNDYLASYDPVVDFLTDGKALLVYARNSQSGKPGYFATIADFSQSPVSFSQPQRISRDPTLILTDPGVSKGLAVWIDSKTAQSQLPDTVFGRFYDPTQNNWSNIFQIGD